MTCANPECRAESLYLRSGGIYHIDVLDEAGNAGECQIIQRRVIWLCDICTGLFAIETWRPPGQQVRPSGSLRKRFPRARGGESPTEYWS
jgi:hypothetical protein